MCNVQVKKLCPQALSVYVVLYVYVISCLQGLNYLCHTYREDQMNTHCDVIYSMYFRVCFFVFTELELAS